MKRFTAFLLTVVTMLAMMVPSPAAAAPPTCSAERLGSSANISIICRDANGNIIPTPLIDILRIVGNIVTVVVTETREVVRIVVEEVLVPGPTRTVTVTPSPQPQATVTVRPSAAPTATVTVRPAPVEKTVRVPGPTKTVTLQPPTATVTIRPNGETVTVRPEPRSQPTVTLTPEARPTATVTETPTGQVVSPSDTMTPSPEDDPESFFRGDIDLDDGDVSAGEAGIGILSALLILGSILGGTAYGFHRGRRHEEADESDFLRTTLDNAKTE